MKTIGDLMDYLETLPADAKLKGVVLYDTKREELVLKRSVRKQATKSPVKEEIVEMIDNTEARFNFREFLFAWASLYKDVRGETVHLNIPRDIGILKSTFPLAKDFGAGEIEVLRTYLEIFDTQIKTPTYKQPTLGGLRYAMQKVNQAMAKKKEQKLREINQSYDLVEEVF